MRLLQCGTRFGRWVLTVIRMLCMRMFGMECVELCNLLSFLPVGVKVIIGWRR